MNFFGFIWVISYLSSLFAPQNAVRIGESLAKVFPIKTLAFISNPIHRSTKSDRLHGTTTALGSDMPRTTSIGFNLNSQPGYQRTVPQLQSLRHSLSWLTSSESSLPQDTTDGRSSFPVMYEAALPMSELINPPEILSSQPQNVIRFLGDLSSRWQKTLVSQNLAASAVTVMRVNRRTIDDVGFDQQVQSVNPWCGIQPQGKRAKGNRRSVFQVMVGRQAIATLPTRSRAETLAQHLKQVLQARDFNPYGLEPTMLGNTAVGKAGKYTLFSVDQDLADALNQTNDRIAIDWINNLRAALDVPELSLAEAQAKMYGLNDSGEKIEGIASWYGPYFHGRLTANGEIFDENQLTAAHPSLPFNTYLKVTNLESGKSVIVRINDRGPYVDNRTLDLSREAARCLSSEISGVVPYEAVIMKPEAGREPIAHTSPGVDTDTRLADQRLSEQM